jgi:hypothetical protein
MMSESMTTDGHPRFVGGAALLRYCGFVFSDCYREMRIKASRDGKVDIKFPKDGYSDAKRLAEALQEKLPFHQGWNDVHTYPVPTMGYLGDLLPNEVLDFERAWDRRVPKFTSQRWDSCFQTLGRDYFKDGVAIRLDLSGDVEHYYNVILTNYEKNLFEQINPEMKFELCEEQCTPLKEFLHWHAVHGYYAGSAVDGVGCAPPFRLCAAWRDIPDFSIGGDLDMLERLDQEAITAKFFGDQSVSSPEEWDRPLQGARVLAGYCEFSQTRADWGAIREAYLSPSSAHWATVKAVTPSEVGQGKLEKMWNEIFRKKILPLIEGSGATLPKVLQTIWEEDDTTGKVLGNYLLRKLVHKRKVEFTPEGTLRI